MMNPSEVNDSARQNMAMQNINDSWRQLGLPGAARSTVYVLKWEFGDHHGSGMRVYETAQAAEEARGLLEAVNVHSTVEAQTVLR